MEDYVMMLMKALEKQQRDRALDQDQQRLGLEENKYRTGIEQFQSQFGESTRRFNEEMNAEKQKMEQRRHEFNLSNQHAKDLLRAGIGERFHNTNDPNEVKLWKSRGVPVMGPEEMKNNFGYVTEYKGNYIDKSQMAEWNANKYRQGQIALADRDKRKIITLTHPETGESRTFVGNMEELLKSYYRNPKANKNEAEWEYNRKFIASETGASPLPSVLAMQDGNDVSLQKRVGSGLADLGNSKILALIDNLNAQSLRDATDENKNVNYEAYIENYTKMMQDALKQHQLSQDEWKAYTGQRKINVEPLGYEIPIPVKRETDYPEDIKQSAIRKLENNNRLVTELLDAREKLINVRNDLYRLDYQNPERKAGVNAEREKVEARLQRVNRTVNLFEKMLGRSGTKQLEKEVRRRLWNANKETGME